MYLLLLFCLLLTAAAAADDSVPCPRNPEHSDYCAPVYMIIGAQKAGTSDLQAMLSLHPHIRRSSGIVEYHYFDDRGWSESRNWKRSPGSVFSIAGYWDDVRRMSTPQQQQIVGDKVPCYLYIPYVPAVVRQHAPWMKFIVSLRNPVDRSYSSFMQSSRRYLRDYTQLLKQAGAYRSEYERVLLSPSDTRNQLPAEIFDALAALEVQQIEQARNSPEQWQQLFDYMTADGSSPRAHPVLRSMYYPQLLNWFQYFPPSSFKIVLFEEFITDVPAAVDEITAFLELPSEAFSFVNYFAGGAHSLKLQDAKNRAVQSRHATPMLHSTRRLLQRFFAPQNVQLEELIHMDLSIWL